MISLSLVDHLLVNCVLSVDRLSLISSRPDLPTSSTSCKADPRNDPHVGKDPVKSVRCEERGGEGVCGIMDKGGVSRLINLPDNASGRAG